MNEISTAPQVKEIASRMNKYLKDNQQDRRGDDTFWCDMWWEKLFLLRAHAWWHYMAFCRNYLTPKHDFVEMPNVSDLYLPGERMLNEVTVSSSRADLSAVGSSASNEYPKRVGGE